MFLSGGGGGGGGGGNSPLIFGQMATKGGFFRAAAAAAGEPALPPMQLHHHHHPQHHQQHANLNAASHKRAPSPVENLRGFERSPVKRERLDEDTGVAAPAQIQTIKEDSRGEKRIQRKSPGQ